MDITATLPSAATFPLDALRPPDAAGNDQEVRAAFDRFVGETLFAQMLASLRRTVEKPAYLHGGRAEDVFQQQLDRALTERMAAAGAERFTDPMYELFMAQRAA
jgi:hypothetical protein